MGLNGSVSGKSVLTQGEIFHKWTGQTSTVGNVNAANTTILMPGNNMQIKASYKALPAAQYALSVENGTGDGNFKAGRLLNI